MKKVYLLPCLICCTAFGIFEHDRAAYAAQHNEWQTAKECMTTAVNNNYNNPHVIFDAGVAAFNAGEYGQAQAYFNDVTQRLASTQEQQELQERAWYNAGNTYAQRQQVLEKESSNDSDNTTDDEQKHLLEQAIASYQKALELSPDDKRARHNLEVVKKRLEKKKQPPSQDQKKDDKNKDKNKDKKENNKNQQGQSDQQQQSDNQQKGGDKQEQPQKGKGQQDKQQESAKNNAGDKDKENEQRGSKGQKQEDKADKGKKEQQSAGQQKGNQQAMQSAASEDKKNGDGRDGIIARILKEQEAHDANMNKNMIKAAVGKRLAGNDGQNCW